MTGLAIEFSATTIWMAMEMIGSILHRGKKTLFIAFLCGMRSSARKLIKVWGEFPLLSPPRACYFCRVSDFPYPMPQQPLGPESRSDLSAYFISCTKLGKCGTARITFPWLILSTRTTASPHHPKKPYVYSGGLLGSAASICHLTRYGTYATMRAVATVADTRTCAVVLCMVWPTSLSRSDSCPRP